MGKYDKLDAMSDEEIRAFKYESVFGTSTEALPHTTLTSARKIHLVAEGDSWFDYLPGTDVIDCLRKIFGYEIDNFAKGGDTLENMIYGTALTSNYRRTHPSINSVLQRLGQIKPPVFLFSGGGNDVAGDEFANYLNHADSGREVVRSAYVDYMINDIFRKYYEDLIAKVSAVSPNTHIVTHGYGRTTPTGKGVRVAYIKWAGPWLLPALAMKNITDVINQRRIVYSMIDKFNAMLEDLGRRNPSKFHYVDMRNILDPDTSWENELHPKNSGFALVAEQLHIKITSLINNRTI